MTYTSLSVVVALCLAAGIAAAAPLPPPRDPAAAHAQARALERPVVSLAMGSFKLALEQTTLQEVRNAIGAGTIAHQGDAGESAYWLCYTAHPGALAQRVWIVADGEMGGAGHRVTHVLGELAPEAAPLDDCPLLPEKFSPIRLDRKLWIGSPAGAGAVSDGWTTFTYGGKRGKFDVTSALSVRARDGLVESVRAWRITSN